ncbi:uncharacterized protein LOC116637044 [Phoca vitulina]|uniref:uncharacterized protein LOC116637044 n=1 Tax=Phoca vitulina TaxID=9720 RepID=UPI001395EB69|nr:uncharacterized protein LOC116637044 [Phoca vitulina]
MLSPEPWIPLCLKDFPWPCQALPLTTKRGFINTDTAAWKEGMSRETDPTMRSWLSHEPEIPPIVVTNDFGTQGGECFPQKFLWECLSLPMKEGKRKTLRRTRDRHTSLAILILAAGFQGPQVTACIMFHPNCQEDFSDEKTEAESRHRTCEWLDPGSVTPSSVLLTPCCLLVTVRSYGAGAVFGVKS